MKSGSMSPSPKRRRGPWLASRQRRLVAGVSLVLVVGMIVLGITDPFASSRPSGVTDNSYPTATATVSEQSLSSQNQESATLGYAGSYTVSVPTGTAAAAVASARTMAHVAQAQVASARTALASARATAKPTNASVLSEARSAVSNDEAAHTQALMQFAADESLGCPASSPVTVTSPVSESSAPSNSSAATSSPSTSPNEQSSLSTSGDYFARGNSGLASTVVDGPRPLASDTASAPSASTGPVDETTSTSALLTGTVNPNGAEATYYFEYGTSPNYGESTSVTAVGAGANDVSVTFPLVDLSPGVTYYYRLVVTNALGVTYGQNASFQTSEAPSVTTGTASSASSTSESLSGTINPNGVDTNYYFEYGSSASFGETTPVVDLGGSLSPTPVTVTVSGLSAGGTYDFALVATSALGKAVGATSTFQAATSSCVSEQIVISEDLLSLSEAKDTLALDQLGQGSAVRAAGQTVISDVMTAAIDENELTADEADVTNANTTFTELPHVGARLHRGDSVYRLNNQPVPLFYGPVPLYRALFLGVSSGPDIEELNQNLITLGFEHSGANDVFTSTTAAAVEAWQRSLDEPATGVVAIGDVVVEPGPLEVASVSVATGQIANGGMAILTATSRTPVVTIALDASQQSEVKVGDPVTITLPNNTTTPGIIRSVGTVAVTPASSSSGSGPTITVIVIPTKLSAIGNLDQAPVNVSITNATVTDVLTVPVDALLALANGGYAVEEIESDGVHQLVPVTLGLFDDAEGRVQVSGTELTVGQKVVVPRL